MKHRRPVNLNLFTIKFPLPAIVSILHRVSGVVLFFSIPLMLWLLQESLTSSVAFVSLQEALANPFFKLVMGMLLLGLVYHMVAGIRHLLMDMGIGETLKDARFSAKAVFVFVAVLACMIGYWLC